MRPFKGLNGIVPADRPFKVSSIHGSNTINSMFAATMFGNETQFYMLPHLCRFDGIIGFDLLKQVDAFIDLKRDELITVAGREKLLYEKCSNVNFSCCSPVSDSIKDKLTSLISKYKSVFGDPDESLPFNTSVVARIRTVDEDPVYTKLYPYPMGAADFVNKEVEDMLANGIIRKSRSPYNNPIWVVDKKGFDEQGLRKKRLVTDFRKLNEKTIDDTYPIPDISVILSNLGKAKKFTKLDLKSGFLQVLLHEGDREKTAFAVNNGKYEYCRLPFGLKNAPSIFQRAIDDILRPFI